jgi:hypothetical protein
VPAARLGNEGDALGPLDSGFNDLFEKRIWPLSVRSLMMRWRRRNANVIFHAAVRKFACIVQRNMES